MTIQYYTARNLLRHVDTLAKLFPKIADDPDLAWRKLRRMEMQGARIALAYCNGWIDDVTQERRENLLLKRLDALLGFKARRVPVIFNGDPRGYALKIKSEWVRPKWKRLRCLHQDFGGYGIIAPEFK